MFNFDQTFPIMKKTSQKKLLLIAYYLPPIKTVAGVRLFNFHFEIKKYFTSTFCLTTSNRHLFPKEIFPFDDSSTIEIWTWDLRRFLIKKNNTSTGIQQNRKESLFVNFLSKLSYSFPFNLFLADGGLTYIIGGYFKGKKLIREKNIDILFSSYKPYSDHLICYLLKKWNPNLFWIADFRDLHVDEIRKNVFFPKLQKWFNRKILKQADIVTTVSKGLVKKMENYHSNVHILRNGISSLNKKNIDNHHFDKFTIAYTGSIYPQYQSAQILFTVLQNLILAEKIDPSKIQLIYAGKERNVWNEWIKKSHLEQINTSYGILSQTEAQEIQKSSHINLLLSWASEGQKGILTAKFYEYLIARNPILLIIKGSEDDEFESIFNELQAGILAYDNFSSQNKVEKFLLEKYREWEQNGKIQSSLQENKLKEYTWEKQMYDFITNHFGS